MLFGIIQKYLIKRLDKDKISHPKFYMDMKPSLEDKGQSDMRYNNHPNGQKRDQGI